MPSGGQGLTHRLLVRRTQPWPCGGATGVAAAERQRRAGGHGAPANSCVYGQPINCPTNDGAATDVSVPAARATFVCAHTRVGGGGRTNIKEVVNTV